MYFKSFFFKNKTSYYSEKNVYGSGQKPKWEIYILELHTKLRYMVEKYEILKNTSLDFNYVKPRVDLVQL